MWSREKIIKIKKEILSELEFLHTIKDTTIIQKLIQNECGVLISGDLDELKHYMVVQIVNKYFPYC